MGKIVDLKALHSGLFFLIEFISRLQTLIAGRVTLLTSEHDIGDPVPRRGMKKISCIPS